MLCTKPFVKGLTPLPCGQCMPCRINARRVWTARLVLELFQHREAAFVTLTYSDENLPANGNLCKRDLQLFLKKLRFALEPVRVRYYAVGEYGDRTSRAHYHVLLYGVGRSAAQAINAAWGLGLVHIGDVTRESCQYVAGYVTKKMNNKDDPRLNGREPEFALMSRRPGIGFQAAKQIGQQMTRSSPAAGWINKNGDVPNVYRMDGRMWPLGRYLVSHIRKECGFESGNSPEEKKAQYLEKMRDLREAVGAAAFNHAAPFVDWNRADQVTHKAKHPLKQRIL